MPIQRHITQIHRTAKVYDAWPDQETIDLSDEHIERAGIRFLRVDLPGGWDGPFALVHYSNYGKEERYGLRLDRDKGVFLDHLDTSEQDNAANKLIDDVLKAIVNHSPEIDPEKLSDAPLSIELHDERLVGPDIILTSIELFEGWRSSIGVIHYQDRFHKNAKLGLRVDLDKQAFLDKLGSKQQDEFLQNTLPIVLETIAAKYLEN